MKPIRLTAYLLIFAASAFLVGCGQAKEAHHDEEGHEESASGATFKPGKGVMISDETRQILGLAISDVTEEKLPNVIRLNVQIFGETHRFSDADMDHTGCDVHGSGFLSPDQVSLVESKQAVKVLTADNRSFDGFVLSVKNSLAQGEAEVLIGIKDASTHLKDGDFVTATIFIPRDEPVTVIPRSSLLRTAEGTFVYVVNGDAFYRTAVKVGSETEEQVEIMDGLFAGDQVVAKPVETLWIIELRATKGGGHSH